MGSKRRKYKTTKEKGTIYLTLRSSYSITGKAELIQRIPKLHTCRYKRLIKLHCTTARNIKIPGMELKLPDGSASQVHEPEAMLFLRHE